MRTSVDILSEALALAFLNGKHEHQLNLMDEDRAHRKSMDLVDEIAPEFKKHAERLLEAIAYKGLR